MTGNGIYTKEGFEEAEAVMHSRNFHVKTDGSIAHSLATDTVEFLFGAMTGAPAVPQTATEAYQEEGTFRSGTTHYDLNKIFKAIEDSGMKPVDIALDEVDWVLEHDIPRPERVKAVDLSVPIVVMPYYNKHLAIDGLHRIARAKEQNRTKISAYVITRELFISARVRNVPETA